MTVYYKWQSLTYIANSLNATFLKCFTSHRIKFYNLKPIQPEWLKGIGEYFHYKKYYTTSVHFTDYLHFLSPIRLED